MQKNREKTRNIRVIAENAGNREGFNIILDFSGRKEHLMHHRHNGLLYGLLKDDGMSLDEMRRWKPFRAGAGHVKRTRNTKLYGMVRHLVKVVDDYLMERAVTAAVCPVPNDTVAVGFVQERKAG